MAACSTGDLAGLLDVVAEDVVVWTDGGGKVKAARNPIYGAAKAARFLIAIAQTVPPTAEIRPVRVNGQIGYVFVDNGAVTTTVSFDFIDGRIIGVQAITNPEKLRHLML